jgi:UDP-N-acetylmuramoyl-tripeptide--D-alanyl-D-alanine ligase
LNNEIGVAAESVELGAETVYGIFEVGTNHPGEIAALAEVLRPEIALISSIGCAHIEHFGSQEAIALEKGDLLRALPHSGAAVLCRETACFERLAACSAAPVVTASLVTREAVITASRGGFRSAGWVLARMAKRSSCVPG